MAHQIGQKVIYKNFSGKFARITTFMGDRFALIINIKGNGQAVPERDWHLIKAAA